MIENLDVKNLMLQTRMRPGIIINILADVYCGVPKGFEPQHRGYLHPGLLMDYLQNAAGIENSKHAALEFLGSVR